MILLAGSRWQSFPSRVLHTPCHSPSACGVSVEQSAGGPAGLPLSLALRVSLAVFGAPPLTFPVFTAARLRAGLSGLILFGTLRAYCAWTSLSSSRFGALPAVISSGAFSALRHLSGTPLRVDWRALNHPGSLILLSFSSFDFLSALDWVTSALLPDQLCTLGHYSLCDP